MASAIVQNPQNTLVDGFLSSWSMILVSEIGDKTFFIACLMAMRYPRCIVFAGAIGALAVMTILSSLLGVIVPTVLSVRVTQGLAVVLFSGFGAKILYEAFHPQEGEEDEMSEAAAALGKKADDVETGLSHGAQSPLAAKLAVVFSPIFIQAFSLTFLAEWGDRSQIATIALAAAKNAVGVTLGGILGHSICTGGAVLAGNMIAAKISHRSVNLLGGSLFIFFGIVTLLELLAHTRG